MIKYYRLIRIRCGVCKNRLIEAVPLNTENICLVRNKDVFLNCELLSRGLLQSVVTTYLNQSLEYVIFLPITVKRNELLGTCLFLS